MYDFQENNFVFFSHQLEKLSFFLKYLPFLPFAPTFWANCSLFRENRPLSNILSVKIDYSNIPRPIHDPICEPSAQNLGVAIPQTPPGLTPMMITHPFKDLTHPTLVSYCHSFIHSFILAISIAPLQVLYHSEVLPTTARTLYRSFTPKRTGNCR